MSKNTIAKAVDYVRVITGIEDLAVKAIPVKANDSAYMVRMTPENPEQFKSAKLDQIFDAISENVRTFKCHEVETSYGIAYVFTRGKKEIRMAVNVSGRKERLRSIVVRQYH